MSEYQSLLVVSFGGPEKRDDVMPFLKNVLRGRNVPEARMLEVAEHYYQFDGLSPINQQNRDLIQALQQDFDQQGIDLPIYFGNRNWHPMIPDTLSKMKQDGINKSLAFFTSGYSCYSGCRQYREDIINARQTVGTDAPTVDKLRVFFNHPFFVEACGLRLQEGMAQLSDPGDLFVVFTAHSIPQSMANGCRYEAQLQEASRLVADHCQIANWKLVYQSRSGPPHQPWLEPDVCDYMDQIKQEGFKRVVVMPIGFLSDHMEVIFDLDVEAKEKCEELDLEMVRAKTVGTHPKFVEMIRDLILERMNSSEKKVIGQMPASHDVCPTNCCLRSS